MICLILIQDTGTIHDDINEFKCVDKHFIGPSQVMSITNVTLIINYGFPRKFRLKGCNRAIFIGNVKNADRLLKSIFPVNFEWNLVTYVLYLFIPEHLV